MEINKINIKQFKKINNVSINLDPINIVIGGNNSGKSSLLEGIHFSIVAAIAARLAGTKTFTQESLLFCPTKEFSELRHGEPYKNQSNFGYLEVFAINGTDELFCTIKLYRGRNEGNVGCELTGSVDLRHMITKIDKPFSIYVPGVSGIPQVEEYRTESIVRRGVASGDANLYLRNVIHLINHIGKLDTLISMMQNLFPGFFIQISFDPKTDIYIDVRVSLDGSSGRQVPLELVGTGVQQALQILSYVVLFNPYILLLDEPDSHLHPDNQGLLAKVMLNIATETETKIIATTHSRHLVDALYDESNIIWLKDGQVFQQGDNIGRIPLLMDIGALDSFEKLRDGQIDWVFLIEDSSKEYFDILVRATGWNENYIIYSYKTSSNIQSALLLSEFIREIAPETKVVIHRDRDFMTDYEINKISEKIERVNAIPFITEGVDIESYFIDPEHLAHLLDVESSIIIDWQNRIAQNYHNELQHKFTRKRDDIKYMYRNSDQQPPETIELIGTDNPLPPNKRLGKFMLRKLQAHMREEFEQTVNVKSQTPYLRSERLLQILQE